MSMARAPTASACASCLIGRVGGATAEGSVEDAVGCSDCAPVWAAVGDATDAAVRATSLDSFRSADGEALGVLLLLAPPPVRVEGTMLSTCVDSKSACAVLAAARSALFLSVTNHSLGLRGTSSSPTRSARASALANPTRLTPVVVRVVRN